MSPVVDVRVPEAAFPIVLADIDALGRYFKEPSSASTSCGSSEASISARSATEPVSSIGSVLHGTGMCRPCGWFWKPRGCQNGRECLHCHLCPAGAKKMRKNEKVARLREATDITSPPLPEQHEVSLMRAAAPPGLLPPELPCATAAATPPGLAHHNDESSKQVELAVIDADGDVLIELDTINVDRSVKGAEAVALASLGSALHGTGECKPCAWFWKPQGCHNGQECLHCHLCPMGALRKKGKSERMRKGSFTADSALQASDGPTAAATDTCPELAPRRLALSEAIELLPSVGSTLHSSRKCQPCAWIWKLQGCNNGRDCRRCHLCPNGEISTRRKAKYDAMKNADMKLKELATDAADADTAQAMEPLSLNLERLV